ncbi:MAG: hypothetical protein QOC77_1455 [Thermoleophilaceae bacterium]|jgi:hypothetical protein|nr:hypothetical protein [Thermoleophilaceae bacterium]
MPHRFRPRLSYANVVATLALVLAVGGTSYAAVQLNGKNLKNRSVAGKKLKKNTLTGTEIKESKLGTVPRATQADNAATADTASTAAGATSAANAVKLGGATPESYRLSCPSGTILVLGECFETNLRAAGTFAMAVKTCGAAGRRLPTFGELEGARQNGFTTGVPNTTEYELTATVYTDSVDQVWGIDASGNRFTGDYTSYSKQFRCVALPTNTG